MDSDEAARRPAAISKRRASAIASANLNCIRERSTSAFVLRGVANFGTALLPALFLNQR